MLTFLISALVWGSSVKHTPQKVGKDHILADEDVVQIVKKFDSFKFSSYGHQKHFVLFLTFSSVKPINISTQK